MDCLLITSHRFQCYSVTGVHNCRWLLQCNRSPYALPPGWASVIKTWLVSILPQMEDLLLILAPPCHCITLNKWARSHWWVHLLPVSMGDISSGTGDRMALQMACAVLNKADHLQQYQPLSKHQKQVTLNLENMLVGLPFFFPLQECLLGKTNSISHPKDGANTKKYPSWPTVPCTNNSFQCLGAPCKWLCRKTAMDTAKCWDNWLGQWWQKKKRNINHNEQLRLQWIQTGFTLYIFEKSTTNSETSKRSSVTNIPSKLR